MKSVARQFTIFVPEDRKPKFERCMNDHRAGFQTFTSSNLSGLEGVYEEALASHTIGRTWRVLNIIRSFRLVGRQTNYIVMGGFCHQVARVGIEPFRRVISGYLRIHIKTSCLGKLFKNSSWQVESVQHLTSLMLSLEMWRMNEKMIIEGGLLQ